MKTKTGLQGGFLTTTKMVPNALLKYLLRRLTTNLHFLKKTGNALRGGPWLFLLFSSFPIFVFLSFQIFPFSSFLSLFLFSRELFADRAGGRTWPGRAGETRSRGTATAGRSRGARFRLKKCPGERRKDACPGAPTAGAVKGWRRSSLPVWPFRD